MVEKNSQTRLL